MQYILESFVKLEWSCRVVMIFILLIDRKNRLVLGAHIIQDPSSYVCVSMCFEGKVMPWSFHLEEIHNQKICTLRNKKFMKSRVSNPHLVYHYSAKPGEKLNKFLTITKTQFESANNSTLSFQTNITGIWNNVENNLKYTI